MKTKDYSVVNWEDIVVYDETSPSCLRWKVDRCRKDGRRFAYKGEVVGSFSSLKYWKLIICGQGYACHRIVYILHSGSIDQSAKIDHIDGDGGNNKIWNLRLVTQKVNAQNQSMRSNNVSGVTGVMLITRNKGTTQHWEAQWMCFLTNKLRSKSFGVLKYGYDLALRLAIDYRNSMIEEQNNLGAGYSLRHGL